MCSLLGNKNSYKFAILVLISIIRTNAETIPRDGRVKNRASTMFGRNWGLTQNGRCAKINRCFVDCIPNDFLFSIYSFIIVYGCAMGPGVVSGRIRWIWQLYNKRWLCDKGWNVRWTMCRRLWHMLCLYVFLRFPSAFYQYFITFAFNF